MKRIKRLVSLLLAAMMIIGSLTVSTNADAYELTVTYAPSKTTVAQGEEFTIIVKATTKSDDLPLEGIYLAINNDATGNEGYNQNVFEITDMYAHSDVNLTLGQGFTEEGYAAYFEPVKGTNKNIAVIKARVKANAPSGTYKFSLPPTIAYSTNNYGLVSTWTPTSITVGGSSSTTTYRVSYDANGGSGAPDAQTKQAGTALTLSDTRPTRGGYDFQGWGTSATDVTVKYAPGASYTADADLKLYAIWKPVTYRINYNPNGGTGAPDAGSKQYGQNYTISTVKPMKDNCDFVGWSVEKDGAVVYQPGDTYTDNASITLYAKWSTQTVEIRYRMNGGTGSVDSYKAEIGSTATVTTYIPEREGYDFLGWSRDKDATEAEITGGETFTVPKKVVTLYAIWKLKTYKVKFNTNGGEGTFKTLTKNHGEGLVLYATEPTWASHRFLGWSEDKNATVATYLPGDTYTDNKATTLYAIWIEQYSITFDANGGSGAPEGMIKEYGVNIKLPEDVPTRKGYKFLGWSADQNATEATYKAGGTFKKNKDTTLYAVWVAQYTITFNANGGNPTPAKIVKTAGVDITLPTDTLYKTGYDFLGWSESQTATKATYKPGDTYSKDKKATLYAVWKKTQYKITFNANGGSGGPAAKTVEYGDSITLSFKDSEIPTRDGYICIGWATKKSATDPTYTLIFPETIKNVKASATLYAVWVENPFSDITGTKWYTRYVGYIYYRKAMTGQGDGSKFGWSNDLTRAEMVTLLWKLMGQPEADKTKKPFPDVKTYQWYTAPIAWAKNNGIVNGRANGTFAPLENITRQDFVKILYSFAQYCELDVSVDNAKKYLEKPDANKVASYARVMVNWAYTNGFIGNGSDLKPTDNITRAEAATIMSRFLVKYGV